MTKCVCPGYRISVGAFLISAYPSSLVHDCDRRHDISAKHVLRKLSQSKARRLACGCDCLDFPLYLSYIITIPATTIHITMGTHVVLDANRSVRSSRLKIVNWLRGRLRNVSRRLGMVSPGNADAFSGKILFFFDFCPSMDITYPIGSQYPSFDFLNGAKESWAPDGFIIAADLLFASSGAIDVLPVVPHSAYSFLASPRGRG
ncbi:hypothetical protein BS47DRAFT_1487696 [Hydnum rufescens UP504]|uniref:Uncharacterized protein n=1 Tax=Hydnum rufescens UP504 TaxID=1448309 RepID=A0A9P6DPG7_9AGAM|nr:hypothetical protein BS47DRAFT_1487696 [Hydnum rufescens UP504]